MTRMRMTPLLKYSQKGFTKGNLHIMWIKVLFSYLQLYTTNIYCSLILAGFILAGVQDRLKWILSECISSSGWWRIYWYSSLCHKLLFLWFDVCVRERGREKWEIFFTILYALRKPCSFLFCLGVPHSLASSLWFNCKWAKSNFCHPVESVLRFWEIFVKKHIK